MRIQIDRDSSVPIYRQIYLALRELALSGAIEAGTRLPPERRLAESLSVNRTTIMSAYRELKADGLAESRVGMGTVIIPPPHKPLPPIHEPPFSHFFSEYSSRLTAGSGGIPYEHVDRSGVISFAAGSPDPLSGPVEALSGIERELISQGGATSLSYSPAEGFMSLREAISGYMYKSGCFAPPGRIIVLSGSQQGIDIAARVLLNPGDAVIVEDPTFFPALLSFRAAGARVLPVPIDGGGMRMDMLEQTLERFRPKCVYTMPTYHNPTGVVMSLERRREMLNLARKYQALIIEDDAYGELGFMGEPPPSIKSMDSSGHVIYLSTFSKTIYPGLRIGWAAADERLIKRFSAVRRTMDLHTNCLSQKIAERFITSGDYAGHIVRIRREYQSRMEVMAGALKRRGWTRFIEPGGGYFIWCGLREGISGGRLLAACAQAGVTFLPGAIFSPTGGCEDFIRLNYTFPPTGEIERGIEILCGEAEKLAHQMKDESRPANGIVL